MPVLKCPECGGKVSSTLDSCPHCGFKFEKTNIPTYEKRNKKISEDAKRKIIVGSTVVVGVSLIIGIVAGVFSNPHVKASIFFKQIDNDKIPETIYDAYFTYTNNRKYAKVIKDSVYSFAYDKVKTTYKKHGNELCVYVVSGNMNSGYLLQKFTKMTKDKGYSAATISTSKNYKEIKEQYNSRYGSDISVENSYFTSACIISSY